MKKILYFVAICGLLVSCNQNQTDEPVVDPVQSVKIPINIDMGIKTRATDQNFESGDKVGIYVVNFNGTTAGTLANSGNHVDNMCFTLSGKWTPDEEIYWKDKDTKADFYCYYPYAAAANVAAHTFAVNADQSTLANYKASDFLWGKASGMAPAEEAVPITTTHSMSNILVYLEAGDGFTADDFAALSKSVKVCNVKNNATINLATGVATATGSATDITLYNEGEYYRALIVPQTVADGTNLLTITVEGVDYTFAKGFTFEANKQHKFTMIINKTSGGVDIGIGGWDSDDEDHGGSAE